MKQDRKTYFSFFWVKNAFLFLLSVFRIKSTLRFKAFRAKFWGTNNVSFQIHHQFKDDQKWKKTKFLIGRQFFVPFVSFPPKPHPPHFAPFFYNDRSSEKIYLSNFLFVKIFPIAI
jgi:hypothetical protein